MYKYAKFDLEVSEIVWKCVVLSENFPKVSGSVYISLEVSE